MRSAIRVTSGTALSWEITGGIAPCTVVGATATFVEVVLIGSGPAGRLLAGGAPPDDGFNAVVSLEFLSGGVDPAMIRARR